MQRGAGDTDADGDDRPGPTVENEVDRVVDRPVSRPHDSDGGRSDGDGGAVFPTLIGKEDEESDLGVRHDDGDDHDADDTRRGQRCEQARGQHHTGSDFRRGGDPRLPLRPFHSDASEPSGGTGQSASAKDLVVAVIGEELGLVGVVVLIGMFLWLTRRIMHIGRQSIALDRVFAGLVAQGVGIWVGFQSFINMGVNLGALPTKGLTLPLMSYGGSAILVNLIAIAVVLRIDHENRILMHGGRV